MNSDFYRHEFTNNEVNLPLKYYQYNDEIACNFIGFNLLVQNYAAKSYEDIQFLQNSNCYCYCEARSYLSIGMRLLQSYLLRNDALYYYFRKKSFFFFKSTL